MSVVQIEWHFQRCKYLQPLEDRSIPALASWVNPLESPPWPTWQWNTTGKFKVMKLAFAWRAAHHRNLEANHIKHLGPYKFRNNVTGNTSMHLSECTKVQMVITFEVWYFRTLPYIQNDLPQPLNISVETILLRQRMKLFAATLLHDKVLRTSPKLMISNAACNAKERNATQCNTIQVDANTHQTTQK